MNTKILLLTVASLLVSFNVAAKEHIITQKNIKFSTPIQVVKPGDVVTFKNADSVVHNLISLTEPIKFNFDDFRPGMSRSITMDGVGVVDVECSIHPGMKMSIFIWEKR
ncbi:MAG: hypothetical protein GXP08_10555 [Gammaproteobacteria bacterium]|nr:hypothetical protein [Gammaproteobacteria bacterium]